MGDFSKHLFSKKGYHVCYSKANKNPYLVYNEYKPFNEGHTHVHTYEQACLIVDYAIARKIPKECNDYLLVSLLRITKDTKFKRMLQGALESTEYKELVETEIKGYCYSKLTNFIYSSKSILFISIALLTLIIWGIYIVIKNKANLK